MHDIKKPNILHIFTDMQRFDTIGCLGNPVIKTPNLDRLCGEGVAFTNAFSPSPVCIAARCSMISGQYPLHTGCYENDIMPTDGKKTFMGALTEDGYRTHGIGKCHFTPDRFELKGFQTREIQEELGDDPENLDRNNYLKYLHDAGYEHVCEEHGIRGEMYYTPQPSVLPAGDHPTQWVADRSIKFISQPHTKPWYLFASFIHPHPPLTPPAPWHKLYRPSLMPAPNVPQDWESLITYVNRVQNRYKYADQGLSIHQMRLIKAYYYACISFVDYQVGRILDALQVAGALDSTLILFSSDHGEHLGDRNCLGKRSMHDSSARVPMIVSQPGRFEGGKTCTTPVSLVDIAPTFLSASGNIEYQRTGKLGSHALDGVDMHDILTGRSDRKVVFSQLSYPDAMTPLCIAPEDRKYLAIEDEITKRAHFSSYMAVSEKWKYFYSAPDNKEFLFDRINDPQETRNKIGLPFVSQSYTEMKKALIEHLKAGGEGAGITGDSWRVFPQIRLNPDPDTGLLIQDGYTPWAQMDLPTGYDC
ncbi:sulfatase-like hydrolase/transferase [uncultured Sphaerochaeta sp.]|uniref:sulfatase family protein n=1 Tax=uncultured Sphaerochaeta sp. TaxID=886478 RepID=UPI002AA5ECB1|nr:sulfatase-like hydrolase/transferase [uncultured Sphaerochaeta sp.]